MSSSGVQVDAAPDSLPPMIGKAQPVTRIACRYCVSNGKSLNGFSINGFSFNGITYNGLQLNGRQLNGKQLNGAKLNGAKMNGLQINGTAQQTLQVGNARSPFVRGQLKVRQMVLGSGEHVSLR